MPEPREIEILIYPPEGDAADGGNPADLGGSGRGVKIAVEIKNAPNSRSFKIRMVSKTRAVLTKPRYASTKAAREFLDSCREWLAQKYATAGAEIPLSRHLENSPNVYALGRKIKVEIIESRTRPFLVDDFENGRLVLAATAENRAADLVGLFLQYAADKLAKTARAESDAVGIGFARVSVRDQSSRWASRSSSGVISLNWRILLLPPEMQTYIFRHELAHAKFMDHSVSFWIFLNRICPDAQRLDKNVEKLARDIFAISLK